MTQRISGKERDYVLQVLKGQFRSSSAGRMSQRLEDEFAKKLNVKYAVSFVNGTATLHSALAAAGVGPGDEVIVPALTMSSTALAVLHANAIPVFADINPKTFTIDPLDIRKKITKHTKAVIPVALYGLSCDMDAIMEVAKEFNLVVIEDDAQCFLGYYKGKVVGSIGHMASFSFQSSKHVTCGEGGILVTNDGLLADKIRMFNSLGYANLNRKKSKINKLKIQDPNYERHVSLGFNYRLSELCSAVALAQVERLEELVEKRIRIANLYAEAISGCDWLEPQLVPKGYKHSYWTYVLKLSDKAKISWRSFRDTYTEFGGDGIYAAWKPCYLEPVFQEGLFYPKKCPLSCSYYRGVVKKYKKGLCPVTESIQPSLLQLKTNYFEKNKANRQFDALRKTIKHFSS